MPEAERSRDAAFYESLLADKFIFRRGDGSVVDKPAYLGALIDPENTYSSLEQEVLSVQVYEFIAIANVHIRASGRRKGNDFGGTFRNIRVFVRDATQQSGPAFVQDAVIYSVESRDKLVYAVDARPDPAAGVTLHPGQPVDVRRE